MTSKNIIDCALCGDRVFEKGTIKKNFEVKQFGGRKAAICAQCKGTEARTPTK